MGQRIHADAGDWAADKVGGGFDEIGLSRLVAVLERS